ncbi:MAG: hypothetical protein PHE77_00375 [Candidatus Pacebacteria bacterium]|nr:hypothetical protein [Candidatus Paceibacterota bacterium]
MLLFGGIFVSRTSNLIIKERLFSKSEGRMKKNDSDDSYIYLSKEANRCIVAISIPVFLWVFYICLLVINLGCLILLLSLTDYTPPSQPAFLMLIPLWICLKIALFYFLMGLTMVVIFALYCLFGIISIAIGFIFITNCWHGRKFTSDLSFYMHS